MSIQSERILSQLYKFSVVTGSQITVLVSDGVSHILEKKAWCAEHASPEPPGYSVPISSLWNDDSSIDGPLLGR